MKRLLSLVLVFMLLFSTVALAGDYSMIDFNYERTGDPEELRSSANKFIEDTFAIPDYFKEHNKEGEPLNTDSSVIERSMLVYGSPYGDIDSGVYRYLGYSMEGSTFTNIDFPHDAWAGGELESRNWIPKPWNDEEIQKRAENLFGKPLWESPFNNHSGFNLSIWAGLMYYYRGNVSNALFDDWCQYVHIFQPPTPYTWGMGVMFHKTPDNTLWYMSVPLAPLKAIREKPDFKVDKLEPGTDKTEPGQPYVGKVTFKLKESAEEPVEAGFILTHNGYSLSSPDGSLIDGQKVIFSPGESKSFEFNWTGQNGNSTIRAEVWPTEPSDQPKESRDALPADNALETLVPRSGYKLTVEISGQGKTSPSKGTHSYPSGEIVNLSATPDPGWEFVRWEGDVSGNSVVMDSDKKVKAVFERSSHTLRVIANPNIGGNLSPAMGTYTYEHGRTVNVSVVSVKSGWKFIGWDGNASGTGNSVNILMDRNKTVIAQFQQSSSSDPGPGDPDGVGPPRLLK